MPITPDQQATLQLLLERGQRYPDLAQLLGVDEAEVRNRARAALTELGGADPDRNVGLTDYLLGQADPIGRADASRHLREDSEDRALAAELSARLRELFPGAELPRLPGEPREGGRLRRRSGARRTRKAAPPAASGDGAAGARASQPRTRLLVALGGGALLLLVVVLAIAGVFDGGDDESTASATDPAATTTAAQGTDEELAVIELKPTSGGDARGQVVIGLTSSGQPYADLGVEGLEPAAGDNGYVLWLLVSAEVGYPVSVVAVPPNGRLNERYAIPSAVAAVAARTKFVDISLASRRDLRREVLEAAQQSNPVIPFTGESVLRGAVTRSGGS